MDIIQLYSDFSVPHQTEGHKHCRPGYVNVECPFCSGNPGLHLSYHLENNYFVCWRCGWHPTNYTISKLLHIPFEQANEICKQYGSFKSSTREPKFKIRAKTHKLPSNTMPLQANHRKYLESRNFDPDKLEKEWNLLGTGPFSKLDNLDYKHRIIIPFIWDNQQVSFDSRDITGKHLAKYMACPVERELIPHKDIVYGNAAKWGRSIVCVEGPTDVWRMGENSISTSGIKFTGKQIRFMSKTFDRIYILFDGKSKTSDELQAKQQAKLMKAELEFRGTQAEILTIEGDPGDLPQSEANYLLKQLKL